MRKAIIASVIALALSPAAFAATVSIDPAAATATPGGATTPAALALTFGGDGTTVGFEVEVAYDTASLDAVVAAQNGASCSNNDATGVVTVQYTDAGLSAIAAGPTTFCNLTFTVDAGVADGTALTLDVRNGLFGDSGGNPVAGPHTLNDGVINVAAAPVPIGPSIVAGTPAFGSTTNIAGGVLGGAAVTQNISFGASTGGSNGGTTDLVCTDDDADTTLSNATQNDIADGATPTTMVASFTPGAARTVTVSCTATREGTTDQAFSYTFEVAAGAVATGPTLTAPVQTTISVSGGIIGSTGTGSIQYTASGGTAGQSTALACTANAPVSILSGGNQSVTTGSQPAPVVVGITLSDAAQSGTVTCNGTTFTVNAGAGVAVVRPAVIPSASTWSKIALFGLLGAFGLLAVGFRRQG